jgi:hypothetical protein
MRFLEIAMEFGESWKVACDPFGSDPILMIGNGLVAHNRARLKAAVRTIGNIDHFASTCQKVTMIYM